MYISTSYSPLSCSSRVVSSQAHLFTTQPGKTHGNIQVFEWYNGAWHFKARPYLANFLGFNYPIKCLYQNSPERWYFVAFAVECFILLQDFSNKSQCQCHKGRLLRFGTFLSASCIYDRLPCFCFPIQSNIWGCGFFTKRPTAWNPFAAAKLACLWIVS